MNRVAIVGAGVAGLAAAWALRTTDAEVTVFEKSRGLSGRAATRGRHGIRYDHGANYIKIESGAVQHVIREALPTEELVPIEGDVWTFDQFGQIAPGDSASNAAPKWTYRSGISTLGKHLAAQASAEVLRQTHIEQLHRTGSAWELETTDEASHGPYDTVLLTPPAPQSRALVTKSEWEDDRKTEVIAGLAAASYQAQFTVVLAFESQVDRPEGCFALLNTDRAHPIAWLSFEDDKPGHVPDGQSLLIVQMAPAWTQDRFDAPREQLVAEVRPLVETLLETPLPPLAWADHQRWRYALPTAAADTDRLDRGEDVGVFFAGDMRVGQGRVGRALHTGLDAADRIAAWLQRFG